MSDPYSRKSGIPSDFYDYVPLRARITLYLAVFFIFSVIGFLFDLAAASHGRSCLRLLSWAALSGIVATGWAFAFLRGLKKTLFIAIWVPATFVAFAIARPPIRFDATVLPSAIGCLVSVVVGYVLFVIFIRNQASTTLRLLTEMSLAAQIHDSLTSPIDLETERLEIFGRSVASQEMGGDLLDVLPRHGAVDVLLGDVSGHGVRAGVVMGMVKSAIRMKLRQAAGLDGLCDELNAVLNEVGTPGMFVTFVAMRFEVDSSVRYASAGHLPILHVRAADGALIEHGEAQLPLGVVDSETYSVEREEATSGDLFVLVTDGLTEVFDDAGDQFGWERLVEVVRTHTSESRPSIYEAIMDAAASFGVRSDDQTIILIRVKPATAPGTGFA